MELITEYCTGCKACGDICHKNAITFVPDKEGFHFPEINQELCVDCKLCQKQCPQNADSHKPAMQKVFAFTAKDKSLLRKSASGGAFAVFAKTIIEKRGCVVGCAYDEELRAKHVLVDNLSDLQKLQGSKYVQSNTAGIYKIVKEKLIDGCPVLFSGTGCQIAALKSYLRKDYDNLITIDIICHGVPSPLLFEKYKDYLAIKYGGRVIDYDFRNKERFGWTLDAKIITENSSHFVTRRNDPYYRYFVKGSIYREACYHCNYNNNNRFSDITIGDYWKILKHHPDFYDKRGVSVIVINSQKGLEFYNSCKEYFIDVETTFEEAVSGNLNLLKPTKKDAERSHIYDGITSLSPDAFFKKKFPISRKQIIEAEAIRWMPAFLRINLQKILYKIRRS